MPRYKITVTASSEMNFNPYEFTDDGEPAPEGSELYEYIESSIVDDIANFVRDAEDFTIKIELIESPTPESL